jgi:hypothetical protein
MIILKPIAEPVSTKPRTISTIAREIQRYWIDVNYAAKPYLEAMYYLNTVQDKYGLESAKSVILYFLSNASTFRGDHARRLKAELKGLCGIK